MYGILGSVSRLSIFFAILYDLSIPKKSDPGSAAAAASAGPENGRANANYRQKTPYHIDIKHIRSGERGRNILLRLRTI
jgi:hypothetical protein